MPGGRPGRAIVSGAKTGALRFGEIVEAVIAQHPIQFAIPSIAPPDT